MPAKHFHRLPDGRIGCRQGALAGCSNPATWWCDFAPHGALRVSTAFCNFHGADDLKDPDGQCTRRPIRGAEPADDTPVAVFIASKNTHPNLQRVLWKVPRTDAMAICADHTTSGDDWMLCWTAERVDDDRFMQYVADDGRHAELLARLGVRVLRSLAAPDAVPAAGEVEPDWEEVWHLEAWSTGYVAVYRPRRNGGHPWAIIRYPDTTGDDRSPEQVFAEYFTGLSGYVFGLAGRWWPHQWPHNTDLSVQRMAVTRTPPPPAAIPRQTRDGATA